MPGLTTTHELLALKFSPWPTWSVAFSWIIPLRCIREASKALKQPAMSAKAQADTSESARGIETAATPCNLLLPGDGDTARQRNNATSLPTNSAWADSRKTSKPLTCGFSFAGGPATHSVQFCWQRCRVFGFDEGTRLATTHELLAPKSSP